MVESEFELGSPFSLPWLSPLQRDYWESIGEDAEDGDDDDDGSDDDGSHKSNHCKHCNCNICESNNCLAMCQVLT